MEALYQFESYIRQLPEDSRISIYLKEVISANHRRFQLLKLAILLHDIGKPETMFVEDGKTKFYGHEKAALKLNLGQTSDIVRTQFGYHIIKLTDKRESGIKSYEEAKGAIETVVKALRIPKVPK